MNRQKVSMSTFRRLSIIVAFFVSIAPAAVAQCSWNQQPTGIAFGTYSVFLAADDLTDLGVIPCAP